MSDPVIKSDCVQVLVEFPHDNTDESLLEAIRNAQALHELAEKSVNEQSTKAITP